MYIRFVRTTCVCAWKHQDGLDVRTLKIFHRGEVYHVSDTDPPLMELTGLGWVKLPKGSWVEEGTDGTDD